MRVVIVGAGLVGSTLATYLARGGYDVAIVDNDLQQLNELSEKMDILTVHGNGVNPSVLERAGINDASILIAATPIDEVNIVICGVAKLNKVPRRFARIRNEELANQLGPEELEHLGVSQVIQPETAVSERILQYLDTPGVKDSANFHEDELLLRGLEVRPDMPISGISLSRMRDIVPNGAFLVVAVIRDGEGFIPLGDFVLQPGDIAYLMFHHSNMETFSNLTGTDRRQVEKVVISGDNLLAQKLCVACEKRQINQIIWLVQDEDFALRSEHLLRYTELIHGNCTETDVLREVQVGSADFYISVSDETEENIMSSLLARTMGADETVAVSNESRFNELFQSIGISHVISPRLITAQQIMQEIRKNHFGLVQRLGNTDLDVVQLVVGPKSSATEIPLVEVWKMVKAKFLIATIVRDHEIFIPQGKSIIKAGDEMIIISKSKNKTTLKKLFNAD